MQKLETVGMYTLIRKQIPKATFIMGINNNTFLFDILEFRNPKSILFVFVLPFLYIKKKKINLILSTLN